MEEVSSYPKDILNKPRTEVFPTDLNLRTEAILLAFNASPKAATLLTLLKNPRNINSIAANFREIMVGSTFGSMGTDIVSSYCNSLCREGLFVRGNHADEFAPTEAGEKYGKPIASLFLDFESTNHFSLFPILGQAQTSGVHSAPYMRAMILKVLRDGVKREADICETLGLPQSESSHIGRALKALFDQKVIDYVAVTPQTRKVQIEYALSDSIDVSSIKTVIENKTLTMQIAQACKELARENQPISQNTVYNSLPEDVRKKVISGKIQEKSLRVMISGILPGLEKQGFLKRKQLKGKELQSQAKLTEKGMLIVDNLLIPLGDALKDGPALEKLTNEILPKVLGDLRFYASTTAELYHPYSLGAKIKESKTKRIELLGLLKSNSGITAQELGQLQGLQQETVAKHLRSMLGRGNIRRQLINGVNYYFLSQPSALLNLTSK